MKSILFFGGEGGRKRGGNGMGGRGNGNPLSLNETVLSSLKTVCSLNPAPTIWQELPGSTFPSPWLGGRVWKHLGLANRSYLMVLEWSRDSSGNLPRSPPPPVCDVKPLLGLLVRYNGN